MVACLQRAVEEGVPITSAKYMSTVTEEELRKVFRSDNEVIKRCYNRGYFFKSVCVFVSKNRRLLQRFETAEVW